MNIPDGLYQQIVEFLLTIPNIHGSENQLSFLYSAGLDEDIYHQFSVGGSPSQFINLLVPVLLRYGKLRNGYYALEAVLNAAKRRVGQEKQNLCNTLLQDVLPFLRSMPSAHTETTDLFTINEDDDNLKKFYKTGG